MSGTSRASYQNQRLSRRAALKALAAAGGALAAGAFLPGKWARPLVEAGILPAHAQGSEQCPTLVVATTGFCNSGGVECGGYCWVDFLIENLSPGQEPTQVFLSSTHPNGQPYKGQSYLTEANAGGWIAYFDFPPTVTDWKIEISVTLSKADRGCTNPLVAHPLFPLLPTT